MRVKFIAFKLDYALRNTQTNDGAPINMQNLETSKKFKPRLSKDIEKRTLSIIRH
jgi:hypothetical protein